MDISKGRYWDKAWSLVDGCTPCSPGCDHCWSAAMAHRFAREGEPGHSNGIFTDGRGRFDGSIICNFDRIDVPLERKKPTVYAAWNDLFHEAVPDEFRVNALHRAAFCERHSFLFLTKRPKRMRRVINAFIQHRSDCWGHPHKLPDNFYLGLTVCNQQEADEKIPVFLQVPGKKFLSLEPMLGEIDLTHIGPEGSNNINKATCLKETIAMFVQPAWTTKKVDAVILGGETGAGRRPMHPDWVRKVRDDCEPAGVPFFFKQFGRKRVNRSIDGREHNDLPWR